ncbi:radical SAM protein [Geobacter sp. FeAm09]|uniref:radical SAM protein n=1 Tax=Geobacter sp. FeAm09 TaxID=2597769 RepID=UPI0011ECEC1D|nr:radical SAM protein [Geobacter sp. FeAm09]QEM68967.1 radical SAM protein [Geobacter sp. FeAm09]
MRCNFCEWRCELGADTYGRCRMYYADGQAIRERFPGMWCSYEVGKIEAVPFYHAYPGSRCLTTGTSSCNFSCTYCSNAFIAKQNPAAMQGSMFHFSAQRMVGMALKLGCRSIVFNVNEPTVSLPTLRELATEAAAAGIPLGCLTNGYTTPEATELLATIFTFFNISLKGLADDFNRSHIGIPSVDPILRTITRLAGTHHVEVTTPVIQGANDHELDDIARFIAAVDPEIPWHVLRLLPEDEMKDAVYPDIVRINETLHTARRHLPYVYFHNFVGSDWVNTLCPECAAPAMERFSLGCGGDQLQRFSCPDGNCPSCGHTIKLLRDETP